MNLMSQTDTARDHERLRNMENLEKELELIRRDNDNYKGDLTDKVSIINHL
jgi:chromosome segregation ATPase